MRKATLLQRWIFLLNRSRCLEVLLVLLFFSAFSILLTWPQVLPSGTVPGFGGDVFQVFWRLYQAEGVRSLQDVFTEWALRPSTATGTLIPIIGVEGAYKLAWFLSHILSGVGMYFLALHLTRRRSASLVAAMIYAFSSFHFGRSLGFWGIMQQQWLPFLTLSLILFFEQWKYRWIIASLVFGWLTIEAENHLTLAATLFVLLLCVDRMIRYRSELRKHGKEIISSIVFLGIFGVLILWKHWETLKIVFPDESAFEISFAWTLRGSNDLLAFVVPAFFHPLVGSFTKGLYENVLHQSAVNTSYIGIVGLILSVIAIVYRRKFSDVGFWAITGLIFLILSLGPILEIAGPLPIQIPLPYYLLREGIPLFQSIRAVDRLFVISMLAIAVLSGYGMFYLLSHVRKRTNRLLMMSMIGTVLLIESVAWNLPTESTGYSSYYENLREENVRRILEIPGSSNYTYASHVWYTSVIHGKIVYNNFDFARKLEGTLDREKSMPGIRDVLFADEETDFSHYDVNDLSFLELARWAFSYEQIDRVIVGKEAFTYAKFPYPKEKYAQSRRVLEEDLGLLPIYEDERLIAYDTSIFAGSEHRAEPLVLPMHPGWDKPVFRGEEQRVIRRNAQNSTSILVVNTGAAPQNGRIRLRMESDVPQSIEIRTPDSTHVALLPDSVTDVFVPFSQLSSGETSITITLSGGKRTVALQQVDWQSEEEIASQTNLDLKLDSGQVVRFPFVDNDVTCTRC
ncbi:MAG: hypothetical protein HYZ08_02175, partial [Candidatus Kerfeldbacteria bacterium]|nr:hypothetical protein [Candidatus Kerfeldbacteria bacterium]